jgi:alpha-1,6-mannosyltransferase
MSERTAVPDLAAPARNSGYDGRPDQPASPDRLRWTGFAAVVVLTAAAWVGVVGSALSGVATLSLAAGIAGAGVLVLSWLLLGRAVLAGRDRPTVHWLTRTLGLWVGPLLVAPPLFSADVFSYLAQGEIAARGLDPYAVGPVEGLGVGSATVARVDVYWRDTPSPYGPLFGAVQRLIAQLAPGDPVAGVALHRLAEVLGLVLIVWAVPRLAAASPRTALWLGVLNPLVLWHLVAGVHNDSLMLGLMLTGTVVALQALGERVDWRSFGSGVGLIALGAAVKLPALVALAVVGTALARRRGGTRRDFLLAGIGMIAAFALVAGTVSGLTGLGLGWVQAIGTPGEVTSWMAPTTWFGLLARGVAAALGVPITPTMIGLGAVLCPVLTAGGVALVLHRQLRGRTGEAASLGTMLGLVVVLSPVVQPWYLLWAVVPLAASRLRGRARTWSAGVVAVFAVLVPPLAGNFADRIGQLVASYTFGIMLVGATFLLLRRPPRSLAAISGPVSAEVGQSRDPHH